MTLLPHFAEKEYKAFGSFRAKGKSFKILHYPIQTIYMYTSTQSETDCFSCQVPHEILLFQEIEICHRHSNMCSVRLDLSFSAHEAAT